MRKGVKIKVINVQRCKIYIYIYIMNPYNDTSLTKKQLARIERIRAERKIKSVSLNNKSITKMPLQAVPLQAVPLKEVIMSVSIFGHGCEDYTSELRGDLSDYYRKNVRVYSRACVPGIVSIGNILQYEDIIRDIRKRFSESTGSSGTNLIINKYIDDMKPAYLQQVKSYLHICETNNIGCISKAKKAAAEQRSSGLSTYLFEKEFGFYDESPDEKPFGIIKAKYPTLGVHVVNVSVKVTDVDGSVYYETIFDPSDDKYRRLDFTMFNLIYKDGLKYLLSVLDKNTTFKDAQAALGFDKNTTIKDAQAALGFGRKTRILELSLTQLYEFFKLMGVQYVNVMDFTCRSCAIDMNQSIPHSVLEKIYENIYEKEQFHTNNEKQTLFGGNKSRKVKKNNYRKTYKHRI